MSAYYKAGIMAIGNLLAFVLTQNWNFYLCTMMFVAVGMILDEMKKED